RQGVVANVTQLFHGNTIKAGVEIASVLINEQFGFAVTDPEAAEEAEISDPAMEFTPDNPFFYASKTTRGTQGVYVQDEFSPFPNLVLSLGLRFDHSDLLVSDHQFSPRIGGVYYIPKTKTSFRASFNRLYMPPQIENLLIASSEEARALSP